MYGHWVELRWSGVLLGLDPEGGAGRSSGADVRLCRLESERGVGVQEIALRLALEGGKDVILADVRSHGYYDAGTQRIAGSIRIEPSQLANELKNLPHDKDIYLYCT